MTFEKSSPARCFSTPPSTWKSRPPQSPSTPLSERKRSSPVHNGDLFHVIHKVPAGDSPYVKAKQVQLVDKDPGRAISMFWGAINAGDRVESALKDMALVMKQLNRSDEAIEAIKSFRHLCPSHSQESLDNILVELYKRSGRIDQEIAMLQHKLKQIEDGDAFVGRRTKQARSQGKKIQITVEQEISRILGNLAWAYLQKGDYKSAEEHYRKALSFEPDRNKQCNLAICLMQMNKITEAKFLLQAVSAAYKSRKIDDSFAKSFERASQMLIEIESLSEPVLDAIKKKEDNFKETQRFHMSKINWNTYNECNQATQLADKECRESFGQNSIDKQLSPHCRSVDEQKKGSYIENPCGKRSSFVKSRKEKWSLTSEVEVSYTTQRFSDSPDPERRNSKVPYTEPKRCSRGFNNGYQRRETWGDVNSDHKPSFGRLQNQKYEIMLQRSETDLPSPANGKWRGRIPGDPAIAKYEDAALIKNDSIMKFPVKEKSSTNNSNWRSKISESPHMVLDGAKEFGLCVATSAVDKSIGNNRSPEHLIGFDDLPPENRKSPVKKSWADMVEEEEEELLSGRYTNFDGQDREEVFDDENWNSNIIYQRPCPRSQTECLSQKLETLNLKDGCNASGNAILSRNPTARRSLCFNQQLTRESTDFFCLSTSPKKASNSEGQRMLAKEKDSVFGETKLIRRNRLQVFRDITLQPESP